MLRGRLRVCLSSAYMQHDLWSCSRPSHLVRVRVRVRVRARVKARVTVRVGVRVRVRAPVTPLLRGKPGHVNLGHGLAVVRRV